jgi:hypothetical protein
MTKLTWLVDRTGHATNDPRCKRGAIFTGSESACRALSAKVREFQRERYQADADTEQRYRAQVAAAVAAAD